MAHACHPSDCEKDHSPGWPVQNPRPYLQNNQSIKGWRHGSRGRVPFWQKWIHSTAKKIDFREENVPINCIVIILTCISMVKFKLHNAYSLARLAYMELTIT
jgi:hypothetical protein